jgi:hypothetical protein
LVRKQGTGADVATAIAVKLAVFSVRVAKLLPTPISDITDIRNV